VVDVTTIEIWCLGIVLSGFLILANGCDTREACEAKNMMEEPCNIPAKPFGANGGPFEAQ
jgi:hypothetical protein